MSERLCMRPPHDGMLDWQQQAAIWRSAPICQHRLWPTSGAVEGQDPGRERQVHVSYQFATDLFTVAFARRSAEHRSKLLHAHCTFRKHPVAGTDRHTSRQQEQRPQVHDLTLASLVDRSHAIMLFMAERCWATTLSERTTQFDL